MDIKNIIKIPVLIAAFFLSLIIFSFAARIETADYKGTMEEPTLPVVMPYYRGRNMAKLFGYKTKIDEVTCRKSVIPARDDMIDIRIKTYGGNVENGAYKIRTLDGERFLSEGELDLSETDGADLIKTSIPCANILEDAVEYELVVELGVGGETVSYYCRIIKNSGGYLDECIDFAWNFHRKSFSKKDLEDLSVYLEPDGSQDADLAYVNIHSPLSQIGWGTFQPEVVGEVTCNICEITDHYNVITVDYMVIEADDKGAIAYYNVREYYRMRYGEDVERCYLLDYERRVTEIFDTDGELFTAEGLILGINATDDLCLKSSTGRMTCFVSGHDLWTYNADTVMLTCVFSFRDYIQSDYRNDHEGYDIMPLNVSEGGDVSFALCGYMNRGVHEGETGIGLFHYDAMTDMVTEEMFMPVPMAEDILMSNLKGRIYTNKDDITYMAYAGCIYCIDTEEGTCSAVVEDIDNTDLFFSASAGKIVYQKEEGGTVHVFDMENASEKEYDAGEGKVIDSIGFLNEDFVYAVKDVNTPYTDEGVRPYEEIDIIGNAEGRVIKCYKKDGVFITGVEIKDYLIELICVGYNGGGYTESFSDTIVNESGENLIVDHRTYMNYGKKQKVTLLDVGNIPSKKDIKTRRSSEEILENLPVHNIRIPQGFSYFVYTGGECTMQTDRLTEAMNFADENAGVIISDTAGIWSRGKAGYINPVSSEKIEKIDPEDYLYRADDSRLDMALGFVSRGFVAGIGEGSKILYITGYDSTGVYFYNAEEMCSEKKDQENAKKLCAKRGNCFKIYSVN